MGMAAQSKSCLLKLTVLQPVALGYYSWFLGLLSVEIIEVQHYSSKHLHESSAF